MKLNKKKLADMFGVDVRTITTWQSQGLPVISGGGKGVETLFDSVNAIRWYTALDDLMAQSPDALGAGTGSASGDDAELTALLNTPV